MFIVERIVSLFTFAGVLFITCFFISRCPKKQVKTVLLIYLFMLAVFAFNYKPYRTADLYRLRQYIQYWVHLDFSNLVTYASNSNSPSWVAFSYLTTRLGDINWMQTCSCLISFGIALYMIGRSITLNNISGGDRALVLFSYMAIGTIYLEAISGIRTILGFSIIAYCLYQETVEDKSFLVHIPLYFIAALFHSSVIVLVAVRFLSVAFTKRGWQNKLLVTLLVIPIAVFIYRQGSQYILSAFNKAKSYLSGAEYTYHWEIAIGIFEALQIIITLRYYKINGIGNEKERYLWYFALILQIIAIVSLPFSYAVFRRYTLFCTMITIPFLGKNLISEMADLPETKKYRERMWFLSIIIFVLSFVRGDICGYKFFEL